MDEWGGLVLLLAIALPVYLLFLLVRRPIDRRNVPTDIHTIAAEGDVPDLARRSHGRRVEDAGGTPE